MRYTAYICVWTVIVYISRLQTASACTIQTGGPHNGGGSCDFTDVNACGYAFDGYWTVFTKPYSYLGAYIPGSRTGSTENFYGLYDFGHRKNDKKTLTSPAISAGRYCLGFWYYRTGSSSILTLSLASTNARSQLWNATRSNVSTWIHQTMELDISSDNDSRIVFSADDPPGFFDANTVGVDDFILSKVLTTTLTTTPPTKTTTTKTTISTATQTTKTISTSSTKPTLTQTTRRTIKPATNLKTTTKTKLPSVLTTPATTQKIQATTNPTTKLTSLLPTKPTMMLTTESPSVLITKMTTTQTAMPTTKRTSKLTAMLTTIPTTTSSRTPTRTAITQLTNMHTTKSIQNITSKPTLTPIFFPTTLPKANFTMSKTANHTMIPTANLTTMLTAILTKLPTTASTSTISKETRPVTPTAASAIPTQSTSQKTGINLDSAIHVACEHDRWNISVDMNHLKQLYPGIQEDNIYLGSTTCKGVTESGVLKFQQSLQTCSATETKTNTSFNFRNKVVYAESDPQFPFIIRRHVWDLIVECDVLRETVVHTHVIHENLQLPGTAVTPPPEHSAISLAFYRDRNFLQSIPGPPLHIKVGDTVYAKAYVLTQDTDVKLVLSLMLHDTTS